MARRLHKDDCITWQPRNVINFRGSVAARRFHSLFAGYVLFADPRAIAFQRFPLRHASVRDSGKNYVHGGGGGVTMRGTGSALDRVILP